MIPGTLNDGKETMSVFVSPRKAVDAYLQVLTNAGMHVLGFEMTAQALARSLVEQKSQKTYIIVYLMEHKAGVYVVYEDIVCFSSTVQLAEDPIANLKTEITKVYDYWCLHGEGKRTIDTVLFSGTSTYIPQLSDNVLPFSVGVETANVWKKAQFGEQYIPPILFEESLEYAVAVGLALPLDHTL